MSSSELWEIMVTSEYDVYITFDEPHNNINAELGITKIEIYEIQLF